MDTWPQAVFLMMAGDVRAWSRSEISMSQRADTRSSGPSRPAKPAQPIAAVTAAVNRVPGASIVKGLAGGVLDTVGVVSPRARRFATYTGVGLLGVAGVIEWPVAAAAAAVVWLTQPRPDNTDTRSRRTGANATAPSAHPAARKRTSKPATKSAKPAAKPAAKPSKASAAAKPSRESGAATKSGTRTAS